MKIEIKYHSVNPFFVDATDEEIALINPALTEKDKNGNLITAAMYLGGWPYSPVGIQYIRPAGDDVGGSGDAEPESVVTDEVVE